MWSDADSARRISIAALRRPGPFSLLPDMLRTLVVLDRLQLVLDIDDRTLKMNRGDIVSFLGNQRVTLLALDRPGRVLNVMGRVNGWEPRVSLGPTKAVPTGWVATDATAWDEHILECGDLVLGGTPPTGALIIHFQATVAPAAV